MSDEAEAQLAEVDFSRDAWKARAEQAEAQLAEARAEVERLKLDMVKLAANMHARELAGYREREARLARVVEAGEYIVEQIDKSDFADGLGHPAKNLDALHELKAALAAAQDASTCHYCGSHFLPDGNCSRWPNVHPARGTRGAGTEYAQDAAPQPSLQQELSQLSAEGGSEMDHASPEVRGIQVRLAGVVSHASEDQKLGYVFGDFDAVPRNAPKGGE